MKRLIMKTPLLWPALWLALVTGGPVHADDTEVFLQGAPDHVATNIVFMIDTAGAGNRQTVIEDLAAALNHVIDRTSGNTNLGLARYYSGGNPDGSYIAHPVKTLLETAEPVSTSILSSGNADGYQDGTPTASCSGAFPCPEAQVDGTDPFILDPDGPASGGDDDTDDTVSLPAKTHDRAGFVFGDVAVPRYAEITEAYIQVQPVVTGVSAGLSLDTYRLDVDNPGEFNPSAHSLFAPGISQTSNGKCNVDLTNATLDDYSNAAGHWQCVYGSGNRRVGVNKASENNQEVIRIPVTDLVQDAVKETYWCGGENLALAIGSADKSFEFYSYEAAAANADGSVLAPKLVVKWDASGADRSGTSVTGDDWKSCSGGVRLDIQSVNNDVMENTSSNILDTDGALIAGNADILKTVTTSGGGGNGNNKNGDSVSSGEYEIGLRFPDVNFDSSAVIDNAKLHYRLMEAQVDGSQGDVIVKPIMGDTETFNSNGEVTGATLGGKQASFTHPQSSGTLPLETDHSLDITALVNEILGSAGWSRGSSMGFVLKSSVPAQYAVRIGSLDDGNNSAPYVTFDALSDNPSDFVPTNRDSLKEQVLTLASAKGGGKSKFAQAYMDTATYMRNGPVLTGAPRYDGSLGSLTDQETQWADEIFSSKYDQYAGPISTGVCEKRHVIMLAQGNTNDHPQDVVNAATEGDITEAECGSGYYECMSRYAAWAAGKDPGVDVNNLPTVPTKTHVVGFQLNDSQQTGYKKVAEASEGEYRNAQNIAEVEAAFDEIVNKVTVQNASLAAPGVAVNQLNRFMHLDQLYYSVFKPDFHNRWDGNMKRYRLAFRSTGPELVDQNGNQAVDPDTGFFKESAQSFWSANVDGNQAVLGGARAEVDIDAYDRPLYVSTGTNPSPGTDVDATAPVTGSSLLRVDQQSDLSATDYGLAVGEDTLTAFNFVMRGWGDPLHSEPRLVTYKIEDNGDGTYTQHNTVFVSTNDGALHAIDADDGSEQFVFIPKEELAQTVDRIENDELTAPFARSTYGLDSTWTTWRFRDSNDDLRVFIFGGQRRGGDQYYAIDASPGGTGEEPGAPELMWVADGSSGKFSKLGQTWSRPTFAQVSINGTRVPVLIFGGGYSASDHDTSGVPSTGDAEGNAVFMVNAYNGSLIWSASADSISADGGHDTVSEMKWSIPGDVAVVDLNLDGLTDHLYFSDLGGQVFRVDLDNGNTGVSGLVRRVVPLAQLGLSSGSTSYTDHRRFYSPPTIVLGERNGNDVLHIAIGSGYRAHPLEKGMTQDRVYVLDDANVFTAGSGTFSAPSVIGHGDLLDVTTNTSPTASDFSGKKGWYIDLDASIGEKVIAAATVLQGKLYFTTYVPEEDEDVTDCEPIAGRSRLYTVDVSTGAPLDVDNDGTIDNRYQDGTTRGLASQPQIIIGEKEPVDLDGDGKPDDPPGPCGGKGELAVVQGTAVTSGGQLKGCGIQKTRWFQVDNVYEANKELNKEGTSLPESKPK